MITLTLGHLEQLRSDAGGYTQAAMEALGCWPLSAGWRERLLGTQVSDRRWKAALRSRNKTVHRFRGNTRKHR